MTNIANDIGWGERRITGAQTRERSLAYRYFMAFDEKRKVITCSVEVDYGQETIPLTQATLEGFPDAKSIVCRLGDYGFELIGTNFELGLNSGATQAYKLASSGFHIPIRANGHLSLDDSLKQISCCEEPDFVIDFEMEQDGFMRVKARSSYMDCKQAVALVKEHRRNGVWSPAAVYVGENNLVSWSRSCGEAYLFFSEVDISPLDAFSVEGAYVPISRAFRINAMIDWWPNLRFKDSALSKFCERAIGGAGSEDIPATLVDVLKPWQKEGFIRLQRHYQLGLGLLLADQMGLGKTLQCIAHVLALCERDPAHEGPVALVVCPATLAANWVSEFERFAPMVDIVHIAGDSSSYDLQMSTITEQVVIMSYDRLRIDIEKVLVAGWDLCCFIIDEAQYIKDSRAKRTIAVKRVPAHQHIALTGTPLENRREDALSILEFVTADKAYFGTKRQARRLFASAKAGSSDHLIRLVQPFTLRRTTELLALPPLLHKTIYVELDQESRAAYSAIQFVLLKVLSDLTDEDFSKLGNISFVLAKLNAMRRACLDARQLGIVRQKGLPSKVETLLQLCCSVKERHEKALIVTDQAASFQYLAEDLAKSGIKAMTMTGDVAIRDRDSMVRRFNSPSDDTDVLLLSLKLGVGLNIVGPQGVNDRRLTMVIHASPWWNPAARDQATARAWRLGQTHSITEVNLLAVHTYESAIWDMQKRKAEMSESIFGAQSLKYSPTRTELIEMLKRCC